MDQVIIKTSQQQDALR